MNPLIVTQAFNRHHRSRRHRLAAWRVQIKQRASDHFRRYLFGVGARGFQRIDIAAIAKHRDAVRQGKNLGHSVTDIDDGNAPGFQLGDDREQGPGLCFRQGCGRFIKDQHVAIECQSLGDLDDLLAGNRQLANPGVGRDRMQFRQCRLGTQLQVGRFHPECPAGIGFGHEDVFRHRHVRAKCDFLVHQPDAERLGNRRIGDMLPLALEHDFTGIRLQHAAQYVHQGRFA